MKERKYRLLLLFPGPKYDLPAYFQKRLNLLSKHFTGNVIAFSPSPRRIILGEFEIVALKLKGDKHKDSFLEMAAVARSLMRSAKRRGNTFDLVITYDPLKTGLVGASLKRHGNTKLVVEVNGVYQSRFNYIDFDNRIAALLKRVTSISVMAFVLRRADGIKLLYDDQIRLFRPLVKGKIVRRFHDFVDTDMFKNRKETKTVLFAGFPFRRKGVDILIDAFKKVSDKHPDWQLQIVGWFRNKGEVKEHIAGHPRIILHAPVKHSQMAKMIGECGIFVLPSRSEAMGRVLIESMAARKPRIGADVDGIPTVIRHGKDGILVEKGSVSSLARALDLLMSDARLRKELANNAFERVQKEFSPEKYLEQLVDFYGDVIEGR